MWFAPGMLQYGAEATIAGATQLGILSTLTQATPVACPAKLPGFPNVEWLPAPHIADGADQDQVLDP